MTKHHTPATLPIPIRCPDAPSDAELCNQTLHGVRPADAPRAALERWRQKNGRQPMHRITGADGVTRWFDDTANEVGRSSSRDSDRATVDRLNEALEPRESPLLPLLIGAALLIAACVLALALSR